MENRDRPLSTFGDNEAPAVDPFGEERANRASQRYEIRNTHRPKYWCEEPASSTEFEVQAFLWWKLRALGLNARGEVRGRLTGAKDSKWKAGCMFDVAIFSAGVLKEIVEVKARRMDHSSGSWQNTKQGLHYALFGVPVTIVYGMEDAEAFVERKKKELAT